MSQAIENDCEASYHFIGIGGIGISAVARVLLERGHSVKGSDVRESQLTEALRERGVEVVIGQKAENLRGDEVVVYSTAIPSDNVERVEAERRGLKVIHRSEALAMAMEGQEVIGVTGTHGKGTVSAMIAHTLILAGEDPSFIIGGLLNQYRENARWGRGAFAVAEIDESDGSHLNLRPEYMLVNNLEVDHLNYYSGFEEIIEKMQAFVEGDRRLKRLALNLSDRGVAALAARLQVPFIRYGLAEGSAERDLAGGEGLPKDALDFYADAIDDQGSAVQFTLFSAGAPLGTVRLMIPGAYNVSNAVGAASIIIGALGLSFSQVKAGLESYEGLENRFSVLRAGGRTIVKDYLSHPTGMRRVLASARRFPHRKIWCVFKPYRFTLMRYHAEDYGVAFQGCDEVLITTMYAAEERPLDGIDTPWFVERLQAHGNQTRLIEAQQDLIPVLAKESAPGDLIISFGGDDFFRMADQWAAELGLEP